MHDLKTEQLLSAIHTVAMNNKRVIAHLDTIAELVESNTENIKHMNEHFRQVQFDSPPGQHIYELSDDVTYLRVQASKLRQMIATIQAEREAMEL